MRHLPDSRVGLADRPVWFGIKSRARSRNDRPPDHAPHIGTNCERQDVPNFGFGNSANNMGNYVRGGTLRNGMVTSDHGAHMDPLQRTCAAAS
jgi:hypothetical protein